MPCGGRSTAPTGGVLPGRMRRRGGRPEVRCAVCPGAGSAGTQVATVPTGNPGRGQCDGEQAQHHQRHDEGASTGTAPTVSSRESRRAHPGSLSVLASIPTGAVQPTGHQASWASRGAQPVDAGADPSTWQEHLDLVLELVPARLPARSQTQDSR